MADEPQMTILTPRRGRPRIMASPTTVSTAVEATHYDKLVRMAKHQDKSVAALVRDLLVLRLK